MPSTRALSAFIALLLLLPALAVLTAPAGGQITPELRFGFSRDFALDENNNTLFDQLVIELVLDVTQAGTYTVVCDLYVVASGNLLHINSLFQDEALEEGNNTVSIVFDSEAIYERDHSGTFQAKVQVHSTTSEHSWRFTHLTGFYDHRAFEAEENPPRRRPTRPAL